MSGFFTSSDKIKVGQTSVAVPAENGLDYKPGGRIDLFIPPTSKFIDLSQTNGSTFTSEICEDIFWPKNRTFGGDRRL